MKVITYVFLTTFVVFASCEINIEKIFKDNEVVPDVISTAPETVLQVDYIKSGKEVNLGNELTPTDVKDIPDVKYDSEPDSFYTLILSDPDAPSRKNPVRREWIHWLVINIPGSKVFEGEINKEYVEIGPQLNTGLHRYVFVLFKQPQKMTFDMGPDRGNFSTENFRMKFNLGKAAGGNFFQAKYDDYVPEFFKKYPDLIF